MDKWIVWCNTDYEQDALEKAFPQDSFVSIRGNTAPPIKIAREQRWREGDIPVLITKPSIFGWGLNWQHCCRVAFVGMSYSFESTFQAIRRCWRFGQTREVYAHLVCAETEGKVLESFRRKQRQFDELHSEMNAAMRQEQLMARYKAAQYQHELEIVIPDWLHTQDGKDDCGMIACYDEAARRGGIL
jgi:hypothetical protein